MSEEIKMEAEVPEQADSLADKLKELTGKLGGLEEDLRLDRLAEKIMKALCAAAAPGHQYLVKLPDEPWARQWKRGERFYAWQRAVQAEERDVTMRVGDQFVNAMACEDEEDRARMLQEAEEGAMMLVRFRRLADESRRRFNEETRAFNESQGVPTDTYWMDRVEIEDRWLDGQRDPAARERFRLAMAVLRGVQAT